MPSGRDPNQTFVTDNARASKRGILIPLLIVGLLVVGGGLLIAWGLNSFFPGLLGNAPEVVANGTTPTPTPAGGSEVAAATPVPGTAPTTAPTPVVANTMPQIPTPPSVTAVPKSTTVAEATIPTVSPGSSIATRPTAVPRPDLRAEPTPSMDVFKKAIPPEISTPPTPPVVARLDPTPTPAPRATEAPRIVEVPATPLPPAVVAKPSARPAAPAESIDTDLRNPENAVIKEEVLRRIDQMPDLTPENRDKLYNRVERTPGMGRVATIFFEVGETSLRPLAVARLRDELEEGPARKLLDDPTVVFVVLGYADKTGGIELNKRISQTRSNAAVSVMRNQLRLANAMHAVAMGASTMFGTGRDQYEKNRVVEVWAVLP